MRRTRKWHGIVAAALSAALMFLALSIGGQSPPLKVLNEDAPNPGETAWPMFGGSPSRNMVNRFAKNLPTTWDVTPGKEKNVKWTADLGSSTHGNLVVAGGRIFVGTNNQKPRDARDVDENGSPIDYGVLMCFRETDGKFLWQTKHAKLPAGRVHDWPRTGLVSSPAIEGNRLYYVSNRCELICADVENGKAIWTLDMMAQLGVRPHNMSSCSPLVAGNLVFAVTSNGVDESHVEIPAPEAPSFIAVDKRFGNVVWKNNAPTANAPPANLVGDARRAAFQNLVNRGELMQHGQWSNPVYARTDGVDQVIFPGGDGWLRAFDPPTGKLLWAFEGNPKVAVFNLAGKGTRNDIIGTPVVADDRLYFSMGQDPEHNGGVGHLWCVDLKKALALGRVNVNRDVSPQQNNFNPNAPVNANSALAWHYGGPLPANLRAKLGRNFYFGRSLSTCAVADGLVYAVDLDGMLHCLDAKTGEAHWEHDTELMCWSSPYVTDGKVYLGNDDGTVFVFAHGKNKTILAENDMGFKLRTTAIAVNNVLFVATENKLHALAVGR